jgi:alkanesulfonate monooxygenase SsuD/methylene tetrahydromethanopterin reductase-like flavin-dependent oxidoreductase (luciferase family)
MVAIDVQLSASHADWPTLRAASITAERAGYDAIWVLDHLAGEPFGGTRMLECFTWLGALAESTSTIELGVLVANAWNRQLGTLAVGAASVSHVSARRFWFGIGAGTSPSSRFASEQLAVGADLRDDLHVRHSRVEALLDLTDEMWGRQPAERFATFPSPSPPPPRIVGVNSIALSTIAGRRAEGVNVAWEHPRRGEFIEAARRAAIGRPFLTTAWVPWSPELLDPTHPTRAAMDRLGLDRIILAAIDDVEDFVERSSPPVPSGSTG